MGNLPQIKDVVDCMKMSPTSRSPGELRFGNKGSLSVNTDANTFYDHEKEIGGGVFDFIVHNGEASDRSNARQWCAKRGLIADDTAQRVPMREHIYRDPDGNPISKAIKYSDGGWTQMRYEAGGWLYGVKGLPRFPYGADRLQKGDASKLLFIFEGEKDVERAWQHGLSATTNVGGAGKWRDELNKHIIGRTVCIVPDNDKAGADHASAVEASLRRSKIDCFILDYATGLPDKADFSDWMDFNNNDVEKFVCLARNAAKAPRKTETHYDGETLSGLLSNKKPTEDKLADLVVAALGSENLITNHSGTLHWNGKRWLSLGDELLRELTRRELKSLGIPLRRALIVNISNLVRDRTFDPTVRFNISENHIISVLNGDLLYQDGSWKLTPPKRERMRTAILPHMYDPDATAPAFMQFLDDIFSGDTDSHEKSNLLLQHIGYALQSHTDFERFAIYVGSGANGKSVFLHTLKELLGLENVAAVQPHMLKSTFHRASLNHKLANIITESEQGGKLPSAEIKALVSGEAMTVDHKFGHPFVMEPFATLFWATNHLPHPHDYSDALYRRVDIVEFNRKFTGQDRNINLRHELKEEIPGILNAALEAYATVIKRDFEEPLSVVWAKANWRQNSNPVACWCEERLEKVMLAELQSKQAYDDFKSWCEENGHKHTITQTSFSERMKLLGFEKVRKKKAMFWRDVQLV